MFTVGAVPGGNTTALSSGKQKILPANTALHTDLDVLQSANMDKQCAHFFQEATAKVIVINTNNTIDLHACG